MFKLSLLLYLQKNCVLQLNGIIIFDYKLVTLFLYVRIYRFCGMNKAVYLFFIDELNYAFCTHKIRVPYILKTLSTGGKLYCNAGKD